MPPQAADLEGERREVEDEGFIKANLGRGDDRPLYLRRLFGVALDVERLRTKTQRLEKKEADA